MMVIYGRLDSFKGLPLGGFSEDLPQPRFCFTVESTMT